MKEKHEIHLSCETENESDNTTNLKCDSRGRVFILVNMLAFALVQLAIDTETPMCEVLDVVRLQFKDATQAKRDEAKLN